MDDPRRRQRTVAPHQFLQVQSGNILHDVVKRAVLGVSVVMDRDDIWMGQLDGRPDLALEAPQALGVRRSLGADDLKGAEAAQEGVLSQIDLTHAALTEQTLDF